ncbi:MAG: D-alanyl-D-alanine carboxypeptidase family protein [Eubacteriales bacterium]|nr:D-alanyl-D-alanine carboxypeptidase family protein [Eubacteriales bacterium]
MKKKLLCTLCLLIGCIVGLGAHSQALAETPKLVSESACVIDASNGEILYQKHANRALRPASITKQMTALLVLEKVDAGEISLDDKAEVTYDALIAVDPTSTLIGFEEGQKRTIRDLMYCMLVDSANDAANILAEYVGGDLDTFVDMMNARADELGCTHTHFANPNGLDPDDEQIHRCSARDMALISYELSKHSDYYTFAGAKQYALEVDDVVTEPWEIWTKVDMLLPASEYYNKELIAGKTGWTHLAHHTFVAYMERGDRSLIVVVMNSMDPGAKYSDTEKLVDYCCDNYTPLTLTPADYSDSLTAAIESAGLEINLDTGELPDLPIVLPSDLSADDITYSVAMEEDGETPVLTLGLKEEAWDTYKAATHMQGEAAVLSRTVLPVKTGLFAAAQSSARSLQKTVSAGSGSAVATVLPMDTLRLLIITVLAAVLVLFSVLFLILRAVRRKRKKAQDRSGLTVVIKTPEKYQNDEKK